MSSPISVYEILSLGLSREIMMSRTAVLRSQGYIVLEAFKIEEGLRMFGSVDLDLAILCHSIPQPKQSEIAMAMKRSRPLTPVLALLRGMAWVDEADVSLSSPSAPEELLACVAALLKNTADLGNCTGIRGGHWRLRKQA